MSEHKLSAARHAHFQSSSTELPLNSYPKGGFKFSIKDWAARRAAAGKPITTLGAHKPRGKQKGPVLQ